MNRRQNNGRRCFIVQQFVLEITDDTKRLVCFLYMRNCSDKEIRRELHLSRKKLEDIKLQLAFDLKKAGIVVDNI